MLKEFLTKVRSSELRQTLMEYALLLTLIGATSVLMLTAAGINVERLLTSTFSLAQHATTQIDKPFGK